MKDNSMNELCKICNNELEQEENTNIYDCLICNITFEYNDGLIVYDLENYYVIINFMLKTTEIYLTKPALVNSKWFNKDELVYKYDYIKYLTEDNVDTITSSRIFL